jgi:hypothetical protein
VERARIVIAAASGNRRSGPLRRCQPTTVWRWQQSYAEAGIEGLLRDKTRKPGKTPIGTETTARVVALTCTTPHQATHWTGRAMAKATGISLRSVRHTWQPINCSRIGSAPSNIRATRVLPPSSPTSSAFMSIPRAHAVVLSLDEKSQIQALDRGQPGLPIKPERCQTMTHDYQRHGTTTLFAALSVLNGRVIARCMQRHRHSAFIRFLNSDAGHSRYSSGRRSAPIRSGICRGRLPQESDVGDDKERAAGALEPTAEGKLLMVSGV